MQAGTTYREVLFVREKEETRSKVFDFDGKVKSIIFRLLKQDDGFYRLWVPCLFWFCMANGFTIMDQVHVYFEIMDHSTNIVHHTFPIWFSPNYGVGGILFYLTYSYFFPQIERQSISGGKKLNINLLMQQIFMGVLAYVSTGLFCGRGFENSVFPFLTGACLLIFCEWNARIFESPTIWFVLIASSIGVGFEWIMSYQTFGFKHGLCPSLACLGTNISLSWLPQIYMAAAAFMHKIIQG